MEALRTMPKYQDVGDLPAGLLRSLPLGAQIIYLQAFNQALRDLKATGEEPLENRAHRRAWATVKQRYQMTGGQWRLKRR